MKRLERKEHDRGKRSCFVFRDPSLSRGRFLATHPGQLVDHREGPHWLNQARLDEIWNEFSKRENLGEEDKRKIEELCSRGLITCVNQGWCIPDLRGLSCDVSDLQASGLEVSGLQASGSSATGWMMSESFSRPPRLNLLALGDVGSTVLMGLKLLAGERIEEIGIWDMNPNQMKRWEFEMNQTGWAWESKRLPSVRIIEREELFDCDVLVFCASKGVPTVEPVAATESGRAAAPRDGGTADSRYEGTATPGNGGTTDSVSEGAFRSGNGGASGPGDVRMAQYEANRELIRSFGREARRAGFTGLFAVVSDPVDPLCRALFYASNQDENGNFDQAGLKPEQIQGYGLGVMNARAAYFAKKHRRFASFLEEGRAFGPHGQDLVIANSITQYDDPLSRELTQLAAEANLTMREIGFKPYAAPALSSVVIPLIQTVSGQWHYSSYFLGGVFMGSKNRLTAGGIETEFLLLPPQLEMRIQTAYDSLKAIQP